MGNCTSDKSGSSPKNKIAKRSITNFYDVMEASKMMTAEEIYKAATELSDDCIKRFDLNSDKYLSEEEAKALCLKIANFQLESMSKIMYSDLTEEERKKKLADPKTLQELEE